MRRERSAARTDWPSRVESVGLDFHTIEGAPYWREDVCYRFDSREIDRIEAATNELHALALDAVERIVREARYEHFGLSDSAIRLIERSWRSRQPAVYGRMDLSCVDGAPPKLLEYNADTPTALLEASVVQWYWLEDVRGDADQFNSIHEKLIARWRHLKLSGRVHFAACSASAEDFGTVEYLRDTCAQAGFDTAALDIESIGWSGGDFIDLDDRVIHSAFKLYPWEWMFAEAYATHLSKTDLRWIEPPWKLLLSSKAILPLLWQFNPDHPNLLPAAYERSALDGVVVRKPRSGREGEGVIVLSPRDDEIATDEPSIYQTYWPLPTFDDRHALVGSWVIGDEAAGIGMREDASAITRNGSQFVPHYFED